MGRISTINQKKEKREQFAAGRAINLTMDLTRANRLALRGQSNPLTAHGQAGEMRQLIQPLVEKINHLTNVQIQASQQVQELKDISLQMFLGNHAVPVSFAAQLEADAAAQAVDDIQEPGQEMSAAPVSMDEVYDDIEHSVRT